MLNLPQLDNLVISFALYIMIISYEEKRKEKILYLETSPTLHQNSN